MPLNISVFGLGYVGCVTAACLARRGHQVIGVDVTKAKVDLLNAGTATIVEEGIGDLVREMHAAGRLRATTSAADAVAASDISLICVGTPAMANGSIDLRYVERVATQIGEAIRTSAKRHTVIVRSTVLPGSTDVVTRPALERASGKRAGRDFGLVMNPEFLREGTAIRDFEDPPFTVIGADDEESACVAQSLYQDLSAPTHIVATRVAEMLKYACNAYHGLKVGFANEIGRICKALKVDSHEVMRLFTMDTKLNVSAAYLRPGFAFGGSCLPKDLRAISYRARQLDVDTPILRAALESNEQHVAKAFDMIYATGRRRVGVLGLAFKAGTDDLRESPMVTLVERLLGKGLQVVIYDREVSRARLIGANREYVEREIPHIWSLVRSSIDEIIAQSDLLVIGNGSPEFAGLAQRLPPSHLLVDLVRAEKDRLSDGVNYEGIAW